MLTDKQIKELEELILSIESIRYKKIVAQALEGWKKSKYRPKQESCGYSEGKDGLCTEGCYNFGCCLLGAAALGKKYETGGFLYVNADILKNIHEMHIIINVFDQQECVIPEEYTDLIQIVDEVRNIALNP